MNKWVKLYFLISIFQIVISLPIVHGMNAINAFEFTKFLRPILFLPVGLVAFWRLLKSRFDIITLTALILVFFYNLIHHLIALYITWELAPTEITRRMIQSAWDILNIAILIILATRYNLFNQEYKGARKWMYITIFVLFVIIVLLGFIPVRIVAIQE